MNRLKIISFLFFLGFLDEVVLNTSISMHDSPFIIFKLGGGRMIYLYFEAVSFAVTSYGIHKKVFSAWRFGWIGFSLLIVDFLNSVLSSTIKLPSPNNWSASILILVFTISGAGAFGLWWKKQKSYFITMSG